MSSSPEWSVIVLAGGEGRRLGGVDKAALELDGQTTLDRVLDSIPSAMQVVVAGPDRPTGRSVAFRQESPAGGGPVAGIAAAVRDVTASRVLIVATDMPWAGRLLPELVEAFVASEVGVVIPIDVHGRTQPLFSAWDSHVLRQALADVGDPHNRSLRDLLDHAEVTTWRLDHEQSRALADIDTPADLRAARGRPREPRVGIDTPTSLDKGDPDMDEWINAVRLELGLDASVDVDAILDVARVAAHNVARPAAPVTTYLLGVAVSRGADLEEARALISSLAERWPTAE